MPLHLAWLLVQLVAYSLAWLVLAAVLAAAVVGPPLFAGRYLWTRYTHR